VVLLRTLFEEDYWTYFRLMQGALWELASDTEEWALRWRSGRPTSSATCRARDCT
jgi:hypothetical protein